jgi:murein DD-endopeptidase MepM/ murein hydrolase activator NlpD
MRHKKYILDLADLQYKRVQMPWKHKFIRGIAWIAGSIAISILYLTIFENHFGSPKEKKLYQDIESLKLRYSLLNREYEDTYRKVYFLKLSDERRYRPVLHMDSLPESIRRPGIGGVDRYRELSGYMNSDMLISYKSKIDEIKNMATIQTESFKTITERSVEWKREMDHFPGISPVGVQFSLGDGFKFREIHPILGMSRWHYGQDFEVPYGTEVYATGDGTVIDSGWNTGGFGNCIVIDHDYGLKTTYGHLSDVRVPKGMNVKRGDLIGISGSSGTSSGPHLHYQIEQFGDHKNPINFFNNDVSADEYTEMIQAFESKTKLR